MGVSRGWRTRYLFLAPLLLFLPLLLSVSELHHKKVPQDPPTRKPSSKPDHLVLGPAAGQGLPGRLQCQGLKAMNKIHFRSHQKLSTSDTISFVTVFTIYNSSQRSESASVDDRSINKVTVGNILYNKEERSMAILKSFIDFIQVSMPRSNIFILTDPASKFFLDKSNVTAVPIQGDYSREKLMLQRIRSYIAFLETSHEVQLEMLNPVNHYIFTDSDIAVIDDLGHIFQEYPQFDLALTFRNNKGQPLNSGFIAVRGTPDGLLKVKTFLQEVLDVYTSKYMKASRMLGDQLALAWVVNSQLPFAAKKFGRPEAFIGEVNGASILFLPCAIYNWTPPEGAGQFHGMPLDVQVIHFKGSRKRLMLESWNYFNSTSNMSDMLCLVLKSGRTKYDF